MEFIWDCHLPQWIPSCTRGSSGNLLCQTKPLPSHRLPNQKVPSIMRVEAKNASCVEFVRSPRKLEGLAAPDKAVKGIHIHITSEGRCPEVISKGSTRIHLPWRPSSSFVLFHSSFVLTFAKRTWHIFSEASEVLHYEIAFPRMLLKLLPVA